MKSLKTMNDSWEVPFKGVASIERSVYWRHYEQVYTIHYTDGSTSQVFTNYAVETYEAAT